MPAYIPDMHGQKHLKAAETADAPIQCRTNAPCRILVVEDEPDIRRNNAMVLHHAGYRVDTADDGASAWKALQACRYDILITDNTMPRVSGLELIKMLRSEGTPLLVILASGTVPEEELEQYPWLRLDGLLLKPYTTEAILDSVKKVLREEEDTADCLQSV